MTAKKSILEQVRSFDQLYSAWMAVHENARNSQSLDIRSAVEDFREGTPQKIRILSRQLALGKYQFGQSRGAPIPKRGSDGKAIAGKYRPIVIPKLEARIVQRSILQTISELPAVNSVIATPFSFGGIKKSKSPKNSVAAVPAAIQAVLRAIGDGGEYIVTADIRAFFTCIQRLKATDQLCKLVGSDTELKSFLESATKVELENLSKLTEGKKHKLYPSYDLGVAQGNSLSPLLGNLVLTEFDGLMNVGDCSCIRYIDDFLIIAPTAKAAAARLKLARSILAKLGMSLSEEKSSPEPISITKSFEFLGVELSNGFVRPSTKKRRTILEDIQHELDLSLKEMRELRSGKQLDKRNSLVGTLKRVDGKLSGWGKHYKFCNDLAVFKDVDTKVRSQIRAYIGEYGAIRKSMGEEVSANLLGIDVLAELQLKSLTWPRRKSSKAQ